MKLLNSKAIVLYAALLGGPALAATTPDPFITTSAKLSLLTTDGLRSSAVHVDTTDGRVTLYGKVSTTEQKALAEQAAARVKGVREVRNMLQVVPDADAKRVERNDKEIYDSANKMLKEDPALADSKISVKTVDKGVVFLTGKATTVSDHLRAVMLVDGVSGVRRVATEVQAPDSFGNDERPYFGTVGEDATKKKDAVVKKTQATASDSKNELVDMRISSAVKLRLWTTPNVPSTEINVDTNDRVVTLFGIVPNAESKTAAQNEAAKVGGVTRVENMLQVVAPSKKDAVEANDKDLEKNLKIAFKDRPELQNVKAEVHAGIVRLTGTVDSEWDKLNAVRLARFAQGSRGVEEQLLIKGDPDRKGIF